MLFSKGKISKAERDNLSQVHAFCTRWKKTGNRLRRIIKEGTKHDKFSGYFKGHKIRRHYDAQAETWHFSVIDIIQVQTRIAEMLKTIER